MNLEKSRMVDQLKLGGFNNELQKCDKHFTGEFAL